MKTPPKGQSFAVTFRKLSLAAQTAEEQAKSHLDAAIKARTARFELVTEHLKAGGKLSEKQLALLPEPERSYIRVVGFTNDTELKKAAAGIKDAVTQGASAAKAAFEKFFGDLN